jgi:hypothetical protein
MVTTKPTPDLLEDEIFAPVRSFLDERGISPTDDDALLEALRARGWRPVLNFEHGRWIVTITEDQPDGVQVAIGDDPNRSTALLRALRHALVWLTPQQELERFDRHTREQLGISAQEFRQQWQAKRLPADDPRVLHLWLLRPLGW